MKSSINSFIQSSAGFSQVAGAVYNTWQDNVGDAFYRDIIQPLKEESSKMSTAMDDMCSKLYRIKEEIEKI